MDNNSAPVGEDLTGYVIIRQDEYEDLIVSAHMLDALYAGGVDNWEGYEAALDAD